MYLLTHHNNSDHYENTTTIASSLSKQKLEEFIPTYKNARKEFYLRLGNLNKNLRKQTKNQFKLRPTPQINNFENFYPYLSNESIEFNIYRNTQEIKTGQQYLHNIIRNSYNFPIVYEHRDEDEEFLITEIFTI